MPVFSILSYNENERMECQLLTVTVFVDPKGVTVTADPCKNQDGSNAVHGKNGGYITISSLT